MTTKIIKIVDVKVGDYVKFERSTWEEYISGQGVDPNEITDDCTWLHIRDISLKWICRNGNFGHTYRITFTVTDIKGNDQQPISCDSDHLVVVRRKV